jgi:hypothetical protein
MPGGVRAGVPTGNSIGFQPWAGFAIGEPRNEPAVMWRPPIASRTIQHESMGDPTESSGSARQDLPGPYSAWVSPLGMPRKVNVPQVEGVVGEALGGNLAERGLASHPYRCRTFHTVTTQVATPVQPQRVLTIRSECICSIKRAISTTVLIIHNHPSGDPTPSPEDHDLTRRLAAAGVVMGIDLVDHIVLGDSRYCSFKEMGKL